MEDKWPYFEVKNTDKTFFQTPEQVERELCAGYVASDNSDEETLGSGLGRRIGKLKNKFKNNKLEQHLDALRKHPDEYVRLYNLQFSINHFTQKVNPSDEDSEEIQPAQAIIFIDEKDNNIKVNVEMFEPVGADLVIDEGKANFDATGLSVTRVKAVIDLLNRHHLVDGFDDLKLCDADENCTNLVNKAVEELKEEAKKEEKGFMRGESTDSIDNTPVKDEDFNTPSSSEGSAEQAHNAPSNTERRSGLLGKIFGFNKISEAEKQELEKANKIFENWLNKNKVKGRSWQFGYEWSGGWDTFTAYPTESIKRRRYDVEANEKGELKYNYEFKIYTRIKNGKVEIAYSLPPGKILNNDQSALIAAAFKAAGVKYVSFNGMTDANEAAMRNGCAMKGLIPVNHTINFEKFDKMIDTAGIKMDKNSPEFYRYKYDLAMQIDKNLQKKGIDWRDEKNKNNPDCRRIRWSIGAYELHPFRDLWEDFGLRASYEKKVRMNDKNPDDRAKYGAAYVIGAKMAVYSLYQAFSENAASPVSVLLDQNNNTLSKEEKAALSSVVGDSTDTNVRDLSPKALLALYDAMYNTQIEVAKRDLEDNYRRAIISANEFDSKDNPEQYAIRECNGNADLLISNMNEELKDCQLPPIFLTRTTNPKYNFDEAHDRAVELGIIKPRAKKNRYKSERRDYDSRDNNEERNDNIGDEENKNTSPRKKMALPDGLRRDSGGR